MKNDCRAYVRRMLREGLLKSQKVEFGRISRFLVRAVKDLGAAQANLTIDEEAAYTFAYLGMLRAGRALVFLQGFLPVPKSWHLLRQNPLRLSFPLPVISVKHVPDLIGERGSGRAQA